MKWKTCINLKSEYSDYCETKKKELNIGQEAEERRRERMARNSAGMDTAVGGKGK